MTVDLDPIVLMRLADQKHTTPAGAAPTHVMPHIMDPMVSMLNQFAEASAVLTNDIMEKRRERAASKSFAAGKARKADVAPMLSSSWPSIKPRHAEILLPGPDPRSAQTPEEFVLKMRQLKAYTGLTLREIENRAGTWSVLPKSTLSDTLKSKSLPKPRVLRPFLRACGLTDEQIAVWETTRLDIAMQGIL